MGGHDRRHWDTRGMREQETRFASQVRSSSASSASSSTHESVHTGTTGGGGATAFQACMRSAFRLEYV